MPFEPIVSASAAPENIWYDWLLHTRHGCDDAYARRLATLIEDIRDRVLEHAALHPHARLADIGSGDGLVAFEALARDAGIRVDLVDISPALIDYTRAEAHRRGVAERCRFVVASAEALETIDAASVDIVTVRAVLAYLDEKERAVAEFARILRPGGRISLVDPIFADRAFALAGLAAQLPQIPAGPAATYFRFLHRCGAAHLPDTPQAIRANSLTNYNERDLLRMFETAGFENIHLRLHIDSVTAQPMPWTTYLATSPRAGAPTIAEILTASFTAGERAEFERLMRPSVEAGTIGERHVNAYLYADKPR